MKTNRARLQRNLAACMAVLALCGLPAAARAACSSAPPGYTVYAGSQLETENNALVNGAKPGKVETKVPAGFPSSYAGGPPTVGAITLPPLNPPSFPNFTFGTTEISVPNNGSANVTENPYKKISTGNNATLAFGDGTYKIDEVTIGEKNAVTFGNGTYYINKLTIKGESNNPNNNTVVTFKGGTFYVKELTFDNNISASFAAPVSFYIQSKLTLDNNNKINVGGLPANLTFNLYSGAEAKLDNNSNVTGLIYAPGNSEVELKNGASLTGAIITGGKVELENNSSINHGAVATNNAIDHFAISASNSAITCVGQAVTISLHDASHLPVTNSCGTYPTITLSTTTGHGDWGVDANGTAISGNSGNGAATYTFSGQSSVTLYLKDTFAETTNINIVDSSGITESASEDPNLTFNTSALRFVAIDNSGNILKDSNGNIITAIPAQVSGNSFAFGLQAITSSPDAAICKGLFSNGSTIPINMASSCINPTQCYRDTNNPNNSSFFSVSRTINNLVTTTSIINNDATASLSYSTITLPFNTTLSVAPMTLYYPDAGSMQLFASYTYGNPSKTITGSSNVFDVNTHHFAVLNPSVSSANAAGGYTYARQGFTGEFTLEARNASNLKTPGYTSAFPPTGGSGFATLHPTNPVVNNYRITSSSNNTLVDSAYDSPSSVGFKNNNGFASGSATFSGKFYWNMPLQAPTVSIAKLKSIANGTMTDANNTPNPNNTNPITLGSTTVRFGRLALSSAYGSEFLPLTLPVEAQYWTGQGFIVNTDDNSTQLASVNVSLSNNQRSLGANDTAASVVAATLAQGRGGIRLKAPGAGKAGSVDVCIDLDGSTPTDATCVATGANLPYLQSNWQGASYDKDPRARATFGVFSGSGSRNRGANMIDMRERF